MNPESAMFDDERTLKELIVAALHLEEVAPHEIATDEPLFGEGLGLDSIDALELGVAIRQHYGIRIEAVTDEIRGHFATVRSLAKFIANQQANQRSAS
jgi:acyl carrier protein